MLTSTTITPNVNFQLSMTQSSIQAILPSVTSGEGNLALGYNINSPEFVKSISNLKSYYYHLFGWFIVGYLFIFYLLKAVVFDACGQDKGEIIAHVLFLKTVVLMVYPPYY